MSLKTLAMAVLSRDAQRDAAGMTAEIHSGMSGTAVGRHHVIQAWAEALATLDHAEPPPTFAVGPGRWRSGVIQSRRLVVAGWAAQLHGLGWTETDLFGCSASAPAQRHDLSGLGLHIQDLELRCADGRRAVLVGQRGTQFSFERIESAEPRLPLWAFARGAA
jgi:hypothetical protein